MPHKIPFLLSKTQRKGIFFFLLFLLLFLVIKRALKATDAIAIDTETMALWEARYEELKAQEKAKQRSYRYDPNYLTDYRVYVLGLPTGVYDRLVDVRKRGEKIYTAAAFKKHTGIADSTLTRILPFLKFPSPPNTSSVSTPLKKKQGINRATTTALETVYGVGSVLAARILKYKNYLGGFSTMDQLGEVYGLDEKVVERLKAQFEVQELPQLKRLAFANATLAELAQLPYIGSAEARQLVQLRTQYPEAPLDSLWQYLSWEPVRIRRLTLYLY